jgi:hypothetical protein
MCWFLDVVTTKRAWVLESEIRGGKMAGGRSGLDSGGGGGGGGGGGAAA